MKMIEEVTKRKLISQFGEGKGNEIFAVYILTRKNLYDEILQQIAAIQPHLVDHGQTHVNNVLDNAYKLLGEDIEKFDGIELYFLIMAIIFHDCGNLFDRVDHQHKITQIYDFARPSAINSQEKSLILKAVSSHCGQAIDGTSDTLGHLDEVASLERASIRLREIAAILRFADELAEGPQRTSYFMHLIGGYQEESKIYHRYSQITDVCIDRGNGRIALTYNIDLDSFKEPSGLDDIIELIEFTYKRIIKMNKERRYAKYYCEPISVFKKISVVFNYWKDGKTEELGLNPVEITDLTLPDDSHKFFCEYDQSYEIVTLKDRINALLKRKTDENNNNGKSQKSSLSSFLRRIIG